MVTTGTTSATQLADANEVNSASRLRRWSPLIVVCGIVVLVLTAGAKYFPFLQARPHGVETHTAHRGRLMVTIFSEGNVESADNRELKCQVAGGGRIISIVPDGTRVEAGAELVQLDRSGFDQQLNAQQIVYERAVATRIQAEQDYQAAAIAVQEYLEGTYKKDLQTAESQIVVAKQNFETSKNTYQHTERMFRKGFVNSLQLETDRFSMEHSQLDLDAATLAKKVLQEFTKPKMLKQLEAVRDAADARRQSEQASVNLEKSKLERIQQQLKYCVIRAPQSGLVLYANDMDRRGASDSPQIEEGALVRERQTIIRLPNLDKMQVQTTVHESRVPDIVPGMAARITINDRLWNGRVKSIASRPAPPQRYQAPSKNYAVFVTIEGDTTSLKPGMTAEVELLLADLHDVITVPLTAVVEEEGRFYAWVNHPAGPKKRSVTIGKADEKVIEIKAGVNDGEEVVVNPRATVPEAMHFADSSAAEDDSRFRSASAPSAAASRSPGATSPPNSSAPASSSDS